MQMAEIKHYDLTIIGAGIAGSALAAALGNSGLSIALVEAQPLPEGFPDPEPGATGFDARVSALTPNSQALLQQVGAWQAIASQRLCPYDHMTVWDSEGTAVVDFDGDEVDAPVLGHIVENRVITSSLLQTVRASNTVTLLNPAKLVSCTPQDSGPVEVCLEGSAVFTTDLLVAADGALSRVREMLEFQTREWEYGHRALVTTVQTEQAHQATAWQCFLPSGPLAFLPLPDIDGRHYCSIVWSLEEELVDELLEVVDQEFCHRLENAFEKRLGAVLECSGRFAFPLRQRHAVDYVRPGIALVGDAAHTIHPLAGQGINLGLADVAVLSEEILTARRQGLNPGAMETLNRYQRRRKGENLAMMVAMDGFKRLFAEQALPIRWLRNVGMRGVDRILPLKQQLMRHAMGIG